jgi:hypothetical protein
MMKVSDPRHIRQVAITIKGKDGKPEAKLVTADHLAVRDISVVLVAPRPQVRVTAALTDSEGLAQAGAKLFRFDDDESLKRLAPEIGALVRAVESLMLERSEIHLEKAEPAKAETAKNEAPQVTDKGKGK